LLSTQCDFEFARYGIEAVADPDNVDAQPVDELDISDLDPSRVTGSVSSLIDRLTNMFGRKVNLAS